MAGLKQKNGIPYDLVPSAVDDHQWPHYQGSNRSTKRTRAAWIAAAAFKRSVPSLFTAGQVLTNTFYSEQLSNKKNIWTTRSLDAFCPAFLTSTLGMDDNPVAIF